MCNNARRCVDVDIERERVRERGVNGFHPSIFCCETENLRAILISEENPSFAMRAAACLTMAVNKNESELSCVTSNFPRLLLIDACPAPRARLLLMPIVRLDQFAHALSASYIKAC